MKQKAMTLKDSKRKYIGGFGRRKREGESYKYNIKK